MISDRKNDRETERSSQNNCYTESQIRQTDRHKEREKHILPESWRDRQIPRGP